MRIMVSSSSNFKFFRLSEIKFDPHFKSYCGRQCGRKSVIAAKAETESLRMFYTSEDYEYFASYIRRESRYVLDARQHEFLEAIVETSKKRTTTIPKG